MADRVTTATHTLAGLLTASARDRPDHPAVEDPSRNYLLTYHELAERADAVREILVGHRASVGDRVGIYAPKSVGTVAAIFGILSARAAYVPVDYGAPPLRNVGILSDCSVRFIIVHSSLLDNLGDAWTGPPLARIADLDDDLVLLQVERHVAGKTPPVSGSASDDITYILYTSGSTGKPKGVVHTNSSALSFIDWCSISLDPKPDDRFSSHAPFHFDLSILDLFVPIKHGATLVLISEDIGKQPARLAPVIAEHRISVWYSTPSVLRLLAEYGRMENLDFGALRLVLFAGEVFPLKYLRLIKRHWHHPRYFNLYGPTETNVCTYYEIPKRVPDEQSDPYPIGYVCANDEARLVDLDGSEVSPGEVGELLIAGGTVMREYWNDPDRTTKAFLVDADGKSWYRTGDIAYLSAIDGYIFNGRRDRMVKRRGYRVELGEIEAAMYRHECVAEAAVTSATDQDNGVSIWAYLAIAGEKQPSLVEMKRFCTEQLPAYMIPDRFIFADALPKTSTDKIDYQRLGILD